MAKLSKEQLIMPSVELNFGFQIDSGKQRLLELNDDLLKKIEAGESVFVSFSFEKKNIEITCSKKIRGEDEESVVLCTDKKTYDIKLSNKQPTATSTRHNNSG